MSLCPNATECKMEADALVEMRAERDAAVRALSDAIRDRDEWRQQHENLLAVRAADVKRLGEQLEARGRYIAILDEKAKSADRMAGFRAMIDENKRLRAEMDRLKAYDPYAELLKAALEKAYRELNEIHARDGVPYTREGWKSSVTQEYFTSVVEECREVLSKNPNPAGQLAAEPSPANGGGRKPGFTNEDSGPVGLGPVNWNCICGYSWMEMPNCRPRGVCPKCNPSDTHTLHEICNRSETEGLIREIGYLLPLAKEAAANEPAGASNGLVFKKLGEIEQRYRAVLAQGAGA